MKWTTPKNIPPYVPYFVRTIDDIKIACLIEGDEPEEGVYWHYCTVEFMGDQWQAADWDDYACASEEIICVMPFPLP